MNKELIVLGIDPGFTVTGYGVMSVEGSRILLLEHGCFKLNSQDHLAKRVGIFYSFFTELIAKKAVGKISLETPFLGKNAQSFLKLGYLRGILYLLAEQSGCSIAEFSPREVKLAVTGSGAAMKEQVARVMLKLFPGVVMPQKLDVTDALAIALCGVLKH